MIALDADARFSRERLAGYDPAVLEGATVLVAGAGALAQNLLVNLALSGVGELRIVDFDEFEDHNAPRSPLFPTPSEQSSWGMQKARVVAHKALALMRAPQPRARFAVGHVQALGAGAFEGAGAVAACVDNPEARAYLSDMCRWLGLALVEGGFDGSGVSMSCFPPSTVDGAAADPCYRCGNPAMTGTFSCQRHALAAMRAGAIPAIQAAAATLGGLQAESVIQALHGHHDAGFRRTSLDIRTCEARTYELATDPYCHGIHRRMSGGPVALRCTSDDALVTLVEETDALLGPASTVALPDRLVSEAYCDDCGVLVAVDAPDWAWRSGPRCRSCGGAFERSPSDDPGRTPTIVATVSGASAPAILGCSCAKAGLPARATVEASSADGTRTLSLRLAGELENLFQSAVLER